MAIIKYDFSNIEPIEAVSVSYNPVFTDAGEKISSSYSISLRGKLLAKMGSPNSSGIFVEPGSTCDVIEETGETNWIKSLITKKCALEGLFSNSYRKLSIGTSTSPDHLTCYPKVESFSCDESDNPQYWPFSVTLTSDNMFCSGVPAEPTGTRLRTVSESWDFAYEHENVNASGGDNRIYTVSHSVSAQGVNIFDSSGNITKSGLDGAREYVASKIGANAVAPQLAISGLDSYTNKYNYVDSHSSSINDQTYSVSETWTYSNDPYKEEYTVDSSTDTSRACPNVTINGTINGFETRDFANGEVLTSKYANALNFWNSIKASGVRLRGEAATGFTLYNTPNVTTVGVSPLTGTITYNYQYHGGRSRRLSSASWENISVSNNFGEDIFATIPILGGGELIQKINTTGNKANKTSLSIEAIYPCDLSIGAFGPRSDTALAAELQSAVNDFMPSLNISGVNYQVVESQSENWNEYDKLYSYNVSWVWQTQACPPSGSQSP